MEVPYSRTIAGDLPWYSVLIVTGIMLAVWLGGKEERRIGLPEDTVVDLSLIAVPFGIVGARLYYVLMKWELFAPDPISVLYIWQGGIGIYGAVIGGMLGAWLYARKKGLRFLKLADALMPGVLLAQSIGRWGNYFNMEAYGLRITEPRLQFFPLAVWIPAENAWHAATFFYESLWNAAGFAILWKIRRKKHVDGWILAWYLLLYGSGRFVIEQLRTDSLYIGAFKASQWLSFVLCAGAALFLMKCAEQKRGRLIAETVLIVLCLTRWLALDANGIYAVLMITIGVMGMWLCRHNRVSIGWLCAALTLDVIGLLAAVSGYPYEPLAQGVHAALCSLTLPMSVWALCGR